MKERTKAIEACASLRVGVETFILHPSAFILSAAFAAYVSYPSSSAIAQSFPTKPIRLIIANTTGTSVDTLARVLGVRLGEELGQQVVSDNRGGAGGRTRAVNRVPACGM